MYASLLTVLRPLAARSMEFFSQRWCMPKIFIGNHYSIPSMGTVIDCYECLVCGYIYDPGAGDPAGGIPSLVNFLSLPG